MRSFLFLLSLIALGLYPVSHVRAEYGEDKPVIVEDVRDVEDDGDSEEEEGDVVKAAPAKKADDDVLSLEEARALIDSAPEAKDAIRGTVPEEVSQEYYDIHARQMAYREGAKEYRASLEARRESFVRPQYEALERHRDKVEKVYLAETEAAAKAREEGKDERDALLAPAKKKKKAMMAEQASASDGSSVGSGEEDGGLSEQPIPGDPDAGEGAPRRKVVTSSDAPDFDPSDL